MKRTFALALTLMAALSCCLCGAEDFDLHSLYEDGLPQDTYNAADSRTVDFDGNFTLTLPEAWQRYALTQAQSEKGFLACYGDGTHFLYLQRAEYLPDYVNLEEYCQTLALSADNKSIFINTFGSQKTEFVCWSDYASVSSNCAVIFPEKYVYTFYFYPADGDVAFAQTVLALMDSYAPAAN